jgi:hypothetical protein
MIAFHSEGPPNDAGLSLTKAATHLEKYFSPFVDTYTSYTPKKLLELGYEVKDYSKQYSMKKNPGYAATGFGYWKPLIIWLKLNEIKNDEIIYYQDANIFKYPQLLNINTNIKQFCNLVLKNRDIFVPHHNTIAPIRMYCKRDTIDRLSEGQPQWYLNKLMFRAAHFVCKKTDLTMKFVREWLVECCNLDNITPQTVRRYTFFKWHTAEQGVLNMLLYKYIKKVLLPDKKYKTCLDLKQIYETLLRENGNIKCADDMAEVKQA